MQYVGPPIEVVVSRPLEAVTARLDRIETMLSEALEPKAEWRCPNCDATTRARMADR